VASSNFIRWCGLAAILGGARNAVHGFLVLLVLYLYSPASESEIPPVLRFLSYISSIYFSLLLLCVIAAIAALHTLQRERYGLVGHWFL
jgi:hypothetical protein